MKYIHNQKSEKLILSKDDVKSKLNIKEDDTSAYVVDNIEDILVGDGLTKFQSTYPAYCGIKKEDFEILLAYKTEYIRNEILGKYLLSENLHMLMSNGCSLYAGSKPINVTTESRDKKLLETFKFSKERNKSELSKFINNLKEERPEQVLDKLYQIKSYLENIIDCQNKLLDISNFIEEYKKVFIEDYVFSIDYNKNNYHKSLLKRITSRNGKLNKVNIFTLNYDVLIEKSAEENGIIVNNGFTGFHNRTFNPSSFHLDLHYNNSEGPYHFSKALNLFKLHGSLTWKLDSTKPPYGITEIQLDKVNDENIIPDCIIYPIQTKKKHSLDLPYSEMFRQFIEHINKPNSTLLVMGYSFLDEHVNDIITNALSNPSFNLIVFSYVEEEKAEDFLKELFSLSKNDSRVTILTGRILGNFEYINKFLIPYVRENDFEDKLKETFKILMNKRDK